MAKTVFDVLKEKLKEQQDNAAEHLARGHAQDYDQYREVVGLIRGLVTAQQIIEDLERNYAEREDD